MPHNFHHTDRPCKEEPPLISVVIPCYNVASTLPMAVDSVLRQTYTNFEVILVDDGSTDGLTPETCDDYAHDPRVRVIHQANKGLAGARNTGLQAANGEFVALLDADDLYEPEKLAKHVEHLISNPELGLSFSYSRFMRHDGHALPLLQGGRVSRITPLHILCRNPIGNGSAPVLRRSALEEVAPPSKNTQDWSRNKQSIEYFDTQLRQSEDVEFWLRLACTTRWGVGGIKQPLTLYRLSHSGLSAATENQLASWEIFLDKAAGYAPELVERFGNRARAYQLRYLARRALQLGQPRLAARYFGSVLREDWAIVLQEPLRSLGTAAACLAGVLVSVARSRSARPLNV